MYKHRLVIKILTKSLVYVLRTYIHLDIDIIINMFGIISFTSISLPNILKKTNSKAVLVVVVAATPTHSQLTPKSQSQTHQNKSK